LKNLKEVQTNEAGEKGKGKCIMGLQSHVKELGLYSNKCSKPLKGWDEK
jgi:hypothetical protein